MAGRPKLRQLEKEIAEAGGEAAIFDRVMDGESVRKIMSTFGVSRGMFYQWLELNDARQEAYRRAQKIAGHARAEMAGEVLDDLAGRGAYTPAEVSLAKARSGFHQWMAGRLNDDYADRSSGGTVVNIQELHLNALRNRGDDHVHALTGPGQVIQEAEVIEDDEPDEVNAAVALLRGDG